MSLIFPLKPLKKQNYEIGDTINIFGRTYKMNQLPKMQKTGPHSFSYDLVFEGIQYDLIRVTFDLTIDTTNNQLQDFQSNTLTGNLRRFAEVLLANVARVFPQKWELGNCPETANDKTLTFGESDNCLLVLQNLCKEFGTEFYIEQKKREKHYTFWESWTNFSTFIFLRKRERDL
ncbi:hypothetical protein QIU18_00325 [Capnocytophaga canimorsus]|nr:hypothetical protein [Capnocytophaga canimorsus]WGU70639.1 hypothetical protein QIU18_00325 [Capnocytophaga canimorsus]